MKCLSGKRLTIVVMFLGAVGVAPSDACAQSRRLVGQRVRISAPRVSQKWLDGTLRAAADSVVTLVRTHPARDTVIIPFGAIRRAEVAEGKRSNMLLGAVVGLAFGTLVGAAVEGLTGSDSDSRDRELAMGIGAGTGFIVGTAVGVTSESIVWRKVPPARLLTARPRRGYGQVVARWTWDLF